MQGSEDFTTRVSLENGSAVVVIAGEPDMATAPQFRAAVAEAAAVSPSVMLDCDGVTFLDSCGVRELVLASEAMVDGGSLTLCNVGEMPIRVLKITGLADYLTIQERLPTAVEPDSRP